MDLITSIFAYFGFGVPMIIFAITILIEILKRNPTEE